MVESTVSSETLMRDGNERNFMVSASFFTWHSTSNLGFNHHYSVTKNIFVPL